MQQGKGVQRKNEFSEVIPHLSFQSYKKNLSFMLKMTKQAGGVKSSLKSWTEYFS